MAGSPARNDAHGPPPAAACPRIRPRIRPGQRPDPDTGPGTGLNPGQAGVSRRRLLAAAAAPALAAALYRISRPLRGAGSLRLDWNGARLLVAAGGGAALDFNAPLFGPFRLGADYVPGGLLLRLAPPGLFAPPRPGQVMKITSEAVDPGNRDRGARRSQYRTGEFFLAAEGSSRTEIRLARPLRFPEGIDPRSRRGDEPRVAAYRPALGAAVVFADMDAAFEMRGLSLAFAPGQRGWRAPALRLWGYVDPLIEAVRVRRGYGPGIRLRGTYGARVVNCVVQNLTDNVAGGQYGYGVADGGHGTVVENLRAEGVRHGYTSAAAAARPGTESARALIGLGRCCGAQLRGGHATGGAHAQWSSHHASEGALFAGVSSEAAQGTAAAFRGRGVDCQGIRVRNAGRGLMWFTEYQKGDPEDDLFTAGKQAGDFTSGRCLDADVECDALPLALNHAELTAAGEGRWHSKAAPWIRQTGGRLALAGRQQVRIGPGPGGGADASPGGSAGAGADGEDGPPALIRLRANHAAAPWRSTVLRIPGAAEIDARAAPPGLALFHLDPGCRVEITGSLTAHLPAGGTFRRGGGQILCRGGGLIRLAAAEGPARALVADAAALDGCRLQAADGSLFWHDPAEAPPGPLLRLFSGFDAPRHHDGTGTASPAPLVLPGQAGFGAMLRRGQGRLAMALDGRCPEGARGAALVLRAGAGADSGAGAELARIALPGGCTRWQLSLACTVPVPGQAVYSGGLACWQDGAALPAPPPLSLRAGLAAGGPAFALAPQAAPGSRMILEDAWLEASAGGLL